MEELEGGRIRRRGEAGGEKIEGRRKRGGEIYVCLLDLHQQLHYQQR